MSDEVAVTTGAATNGTATTEGFSEIAEIMT
jgi:hypothetical protein